MLAVALLTITSALAQRCQSTSAPGYGVPGVAENSGEGFVGCMAFWDPDGGGPQHPLLVIGGRFEIAGNALVENIATYDLESGVWAPLGAGFNNTVRAVTVFGNGTLVASGDFTRSGPRSVSTLASWNGLEWNTVGADRTEQAIGDVDALAAGLNGELYTAGAFRPGESRPFTNVARWDGQHWNMMGELPMISPSGYVHCVLTLSNGDVLTGGQFWLGTNGRNRSLARWNGLEWRTIGDSQFGGSDPRVFAVAELPNGDLVVSGSFESVNGIPAAGIARWDGTQWRSFGPGLMRDFSVGVGFALAILPDGSLVAGGEFQSAGGVAADSVARWDGTHWMPLDTGMPSQHTASLAVLPSGDLVAGGQFDIAGDRVCTSIAKWTGTQWTPLHTGTDEGVWGLLVAGPNRTYAMGRFFSIEGTEAKGVAAWNGTSWENLGDGIRPPQGSRYWSSAAAVLDDGRLVVGGGYYEIGEVRANSVAIWDGHNWSPLGAGLGDGYGWVNALLPAPGSQVIAGGTFFSSAGQPLSCVAQWNGTTWESIGPGLRCGSDYPGVVALVRMPNGDVVAGGNFGSPYNDEYWCVARWDGSTWSALGGGLGGYVYSLVLLPDGKLVAGGGFSTWQGRRLNSIAIWDGSEWSALGEGVDGYIRALALDHAGGIVVGGEFEHAGGVPARSIARWDGERWTPLNGALNGSRATVDSLVCESEGTILAGGYFSGAGGQASTFLARFHVQCECPADLDDGSQTGTPDGGVTIDDLLFFVAEYLAGRLGSDLDDGTFTGTRDGGVTIDDLLYFLQRFEAGC